ncbi:hypothetical protein AQUCO_00300191v1 [Aquilegia coerulea]|uniref:SWIM-type domain-containing protein n=1 Tax=Aquilegia coerulea TaxID=218851 RepID=A0A2G5EXM1_AQUCA|nr:hypothetical protein AQUCO_00300191v1 [Aquilegia coerulea]
MFPSANVRYCMRHLVANMKTRHKGLDSFAWAASKSYTKSLFRKNMDELKKKNKTAYEWLMGDKVGGPKVFSRSHFDKTSKSEHVSNNFSEAWNAHILEARDKPLIKLVVRIMTLQMKMLYDRQQKLASWHDDAIVPRVVEELQEMQKHTGEYTVGGSSDNTFQVLHTISGGWARVRLAEGKCTCKQWQKRGFPCIHVVCVLKPRRIPYYKYCSPYVLAKAYKAACRDNIIPILCEDEWEPIQENNTVFPPIRERQPGRPKVNRIRSAQEDPDRRTVKCSSCGGFGHNKKGCQGGPVGEKIPLQDNNNVVEKERNKGGRPRTRPLKNTNLPPRYQPPEDNGRGRGRGKTRGRSGRGRTQSSNGRGAGRGRGENIVDIDQAEPSLAEMFAGRGEGGRVSGAGRGRASGGGAGRGRGENIVDIDQAEPSLAEMFAGRREGGEIEPNLPGMFTPTTEEVLPPATEEVLPPATEETLAPSTQPQQAEGQPPSKPQKRKIFHPTQALHKRKSKALNTL